MSTSKSRSAKKSNGKAPKSFRIRTYQAGFGECLLLTFGYPGRDRHVLIDFGTVKLPENVPKDQLDRIALDIEKECGKDGLVGVVATHRHRDHISGFAPGGKNGSGNIIARLNPKHVLQPWTEDPKAKRNAKTASDQHTKGFVASLVDMQSFAQHVVNEARALDRRNWKGFSGQLGFIGENNLSNLPAVTNLMTMGAKNGHEYLSAGDKTSLERDLPGVKIHVLGAPNLEQSERIKKESMSNADEFWQLQAATGDFWKLQNDSVEQSKAGPVLKNALEVKGSIPLNARWFKRKADDIRADQLLGLVRVLDKALNNTSLILLFEMAGKRFLFPGDAQLENWEYALSQPKMRALLHGVDLYKVGHHGSRNATPKSMWKELQVRNGADKLASIVSTLPGVYGSEEKKTEVPRASLLKELKNKSTFYSTVGQHELGHDITFNF